MRQVWRAVRVVVVVVLLTGCSIGSGESGDPTEAGTNGSSARGATGSPNAPDPTSPPTPSPTPTPPPLAHCYEPRPASLMPTPTPEPPASDAASPVAPPEATPETSPSEAASPGASPEGSPSEAAPPGFTLRPADERSLFQSCQVVAYYGYPDEPVMGVLGTADPETVVAQLLDQAAAYDAANGDRGVAPALHLIYAVAQAYETDDGTYLYRMPDELVQQYLEVAEQHDLLVFLDIQMGHSSVAAELPHVLPYLANPRVHLALDPEFSTPGEVPGTVIGGMDAEQINEAQQALQRLVEEQHLPNKILIVHQFTSDMILNKPALLDVPGVDLVIDMDGFGVDGQKIANYDVFVAEEGAEHGGFKLFYTQDAPLMTPEEVEALQPQPDVVIYQ